jgi:hypothetical protein
MLNRVRILTRSNLNHRLWIRPVTVAAIGAALLTPTTPAMAADGVRTGWGNPERICTIHNNRVTELSGLAVTPYGFLAINDSNRRADAMRVFMFNHRCQMIGSIGYPRRPLDPEDLQIARNGDLWVADIGDNGAMSFDRRRRGTVALWRFPRHGGTPSVHRLAYPDRRHNAEAMVLNGDGTPIIVTKERSGTAGLYMPTGRHRGGVQVMRRVGSFTPPTRWSRAWRRPVVTAGANSPDGRKVVLRTYTTAYEWDVYGGDVVGAITRGRPRATSLLGEPGGEAIAYNRSGTAFYTVCDQKGPTTVRRYAAG